MGSRMKKDSAKAVAIVRICRIRDMDGRENFHVTLCDADDAKFNTNAVYTSDFNSAAGFAKDFIEQSGSWMRGKGKKSVEPSIRCETFLSCIKDKYSPEAKRSCLDCANLKVCAKEYDRIMKILMEKD